MSFSHFSFLHFFSAVFLVFLVCRLFQPFFYNSFVCVCLLFCLYFIWPLCLSCFLLCLSFFALSLSSIFFPSSLLSFLAFCLLCVFLLPLSSFIFPWQLSVSFFSYSFCLVFVQVFFSVLSFPFAFDLCLLCFSSFLPFFFDCVFLF